MKKYILILLCLITAFVAVAKPPKLNLDKLFDGSYDTNPSVSIQISQKDGKFFKGFTVRKNPSLVKTIWTLFKKDQEKGKDPLDLKGASAYSSFKIGTITERFMWVSPMIHPENVFFHRRPSRSIQIIP